MQKEIYRTPIAVASPQRTSRYGEYIPFSERMGLKKKDIEVLKENNKYRIEAEYSPYERDTCMVIYKKEYSEKDVLQKDVLQEVVWKVKELGYLFVQEKDGTREFVLDYNVDYDYNRDKVIGTIRTKRTTDLGELNWFLSMHEAQSILHKGHGVLIDEELMEQFEAIRVAFRLKNSK